MDKINELAAFHGAALNQNLPSDTRLACALVVLENGLEYFLSDAQDRVFEINEENGWYEDTRTFGEDVALIHSEVSEALEAFRENGFTRSLVCKSCGDVVVYDDRTVFGPPEGMEVENSFEYCCGVPMKPEGVASEFADILIRLLDNTRRYPTMLAREMNLKLSYNASRGYKHGGKRL